MESQQCCCGAVGSLNRKMRHIVTGTIIYLCDKCANEEPTPADYEAIEEIQFLPLGICPRCKSTELRRDSLRGCWVCDCGVIITDAAFGLRSPYYNEYVEE